MRPVTSIISLAFVVVALACSETTKPVSSPIIGGWMSPRENLQPRGSFFRYLGFSESGKFTYVINSYGVYEGESPGAQSAYTNISGTYQVDGDRLVLTANRVANWDAFYGANSRERVEQVNMIVLDEARFRIVNGKLIIDYVTYPADAPVPTTQVFTRLGLD
jgi:hypothetical protein